MTVGAQRAKAPVPTYGISSKLSWVRQWWTERALNFGETRYKCLYVHVVIVIPRHACVCVIIVIWLNESPTQHMGTLSEGKQWQVLLVESVLVHLQ